MTKFVYGTRGAANPHNHNIYSLFLEKLGIKPEDEGELLGRGLTHEQIRAGKYGSKGNNKEKRTYTALADLNATENLDNVPGFYMDAKSGYRSMAYVSGLVIPVCDFNGHHKSLLIRNDRAKTDSRGRLANKYVTFSSSGKPKGERVYHTTHCPIVKGPPKEACGVTARLTEGVLKADVSTAIGDLYTLGIQGLNVHDDFAATIDQLEISTIQICFDQGEDDSLDMIRGKARLINRIKEIGIDFQIETWSPEYGKGIDDVLKNGHADKIRFLTQEEIDSIMDAAKQVDPYDGQWIYVVHEKKIFNKGNLKSWEKQQFADMFGLVKGEVVSQLLAERKMEFVERTSYWPGRGETVEDQGFKCLNTWRGNDIEPIQGDISVFLDLLDFLIPNDEERDLAQKWMAWVVRNQGQKILFSMMLIGAQGTGKSMLVRLLKNLIGPENAVSVSTDQLLEGFNQYLMNRSLIICEELMARGRQDIHNKVKPWITEDTVMIRDMQKAAFPYTNRFNCMWLSNFIDAVPIDDEDRRFMMIGTTMESRGPEFYSKLAEWIEQPENIQAVLWHLNDLDLSDFHAKGRAPMTPTKKTAISSNLSPLDEFITHRIDDNAFPFNGELCSIRHLRDRRVCPPALEKMSDFKWSAALKKAGAIKIEERILLSDGSRATLWAYGPRKGILTNLKNTTPEHLRAIYERNALDSEPGNPMIENLESM